jgi:hypothetical protein
MHVEADLLNSVVNIRPSECEVLQGTSKTAKIRSLKVRKRRAGDGRQLGIGVNRCSAGLACSHAGSGKNVEHVLVLRQEKTIWASLDMHAQEVVKLSQILHGELRLQGSDDAVQETHGGGC